MTDQEENDSRLRDIVSRDAPAKLAQLVDQLERAINQYNKTECDSISLVRNQTGVEIIRQTFPFFYVGTNVSAVIGPTPGTCRNRAVSFS